MSGSVRLVAVAALVAAACAPPAEERARVCNGSEALCARALEDVTFAGAHNAMSSAAENFAVPNQNLLIGEMLRAGIRAFLVDTYLDGDGDAAVPALCHSSCALGSVPLSVVFGDLRAFLDEDPGAVVELLVEDYLDPAVFADELARADIAAAAYDPAVTLGALVDADTRVLVFSEHVAAADAPARYTPMYARAFVDTPYDFTTPAELEDDASCARLRGADENPLLLVNHWIADPVPSAASSATVNTRAVLEERARRCAQLRGHARAHVLAADFVDVGDLVETVAALNAD